MVKNVRAFERRQWFEKWAADYLFLQNYDIHTILDIGANTGQFARMIHHVCPGAEIHSFEPLADCYKELKDALDGWAGHHCHQFALGDNPGTAQFNHCEFTPCSSMLAPDARLIRDHPGAGKYRTETIQVRRLDDFIAETKLAREILTKIDVQGFEDKVIQGGEMALRQSRFVVLEVPFYPMYKAQPTFHDLYDLLSRRGFVFRGTAGQNISKNDHRILEADAIFENENPPAS